MSRTRLNFAGLLPIFFRMLRHLALAAFSFTIVGVAVFPYWIAVERLQGEREYAASASGRLRVSMQCTVAGVQPVGDTRAVVATRMRREIGAARCVPGPGWVTLSAVDSLPLAPPADMLVRPLRDLRISVTDRCNFRCSYCMPAEVFGERYEFLPRREILSFEEITRVARVAAGLGAGKLRITGGEPLLRADLPRLVAMLAALDGVEDLALTTNAYLLPRLAGPLREAGLQRLTISLDSLDPAVFRVLNGVGLTIERVLEGIEAAEKAGFRSLKFNCVVQRGINEHTLADLARRFRGTGHIVRFIEFMDVGTLNGWDLAQVVPAAEILERVGAEFPLEPVDPNYTGEVARRYRFLDGSGEIGIIASVTQPFCGDCTRARLSADGQLVTCLFASGGHDLKQPLRSGIADGELRDLIRRVWTRRSDRYSELRTAETAASGPGDRIEMYRIGG